MSPRRRLRALGLAWLVGAGLVCAGAVGAEVREFDVLRLQAQPSGPVVLLLGGIQGDEPGGFHAAALVATRYRIDHGRVWVVPNLNFHSILRRHRGLHGDLNRKFAQLAHDDPEYELVQSIKALIEHPDVALVVNLHDGSGFYDPQRIDASRNPTRWGQTVVIDGAEYVAGSRSLGELAQSMAASANQHLPPRLHLAVKNTRTAAGDPEMQQALTWFALSRGKPAIASEASKNLGTADRVWSHLALIEAGFQAMGVSFERDFELASAPIADAIESGLMVGLNAGRLCLPLDDVRPILRGIPLVGPARRDFVGNNPLLALREQATGVEVRYGNRRLTTLLAERLAAAAAVPIQIEADGKHLRVEPCASLTVVDSVRIEAPAGYRVNAIGAGGRDDQARPLRLADFDPAYSIDRGGRRFRLEIYRADAFAGMVNLHFARPGELALQTASHRRRHSESK